MTIGSIVAKHRVTERGRVFESLYYGFWEWHYFDEI